MIYDFNHRLLHLFHEFRLSHRVRQILFNLQIVVQKIAVTSDRKNVGIYIKPPTVCFDKKRG